MTNTNILRITCEELKQLIDRGGDVVLIDTRDNTSYNREHIEGAVNIYYDPSGYSMDREMTLAALPADKLLVPYCDCMDDSTSALVALELIGLRYDLEKVKALSGGIPRWRELDFPFEKQSV